MSNTNIYWTLWSHNIYEKKWTIDTYNKIKIFFKDNYSLHIKENNTYFLMKEDILPIWEDESHKNGGIWSFKIKNKMDKSIWHKIVNNVISGNFFKHIENVNGISYHPKKNIDIFKIWASDTENIYLKKKIDFADKKVIFKKNIY